MADISARPPKSSMLLDYLRLFRIPNVFTAIADVAMGFLFVHRSLEPIGVLICLAIGSALLYTAGMILNDVYDVDIDRKERPERPLPSGAISLQWARTLGYAMLVAGVGAALAAGFFQRPPETEFDKAALIWRGGVVAALLAACIVGYDAGLKRTVAGPVAMGACRFFNVLLGMSVAAPASHPIVIGFGAHHFIAAGGIGIYIVGVTWFARNEATDSSKPQLAMSFVVMLAGIALLSLLHNAYRDEFRHVQSNIGSVSTWWLFLLLLTCTIAPRCLVAIANPTPKHVQAAIKQCIFSLIVLDAAIVADIMPIQYAFGIWALLVPSYLLGKWVYST